VPAATRLAGVGRTSIYGAIGAGDLASCKVGTRRLILVEDLRAWLARQRHAGTRPASTATVLRSPARAAKARRERAGAGR
jgi:excisionase family DNA binding protein